MGIEQWGKQHSSHHGTNILVKETDRQKDKSKSKTVKRASISYCTKLFGSWFRYPDEIARNIFFFKSLQFLIFKKQVARVQTAKDLSKNFFESPQFPRSDGKEYLKRREKRMEWWKMLPQTGWSEPWVKWESNWCSYLKESIPGIASVNAKALRGDMLGSPKVQLGSQ